MHKSAVLNNPIQAEVRFPCIGVRETGLITQMDTDIIALSLPTGSTTLKRVPQGEEGEVIIIVQEIIHRCQVVFTEFHNNTLVVEIGHILRSYQNRTTDRIKATMPVSWRVRRDGKLCGAWYAGQTQDISASGVRLLLPYLLEIPQNIEMLLYIGSSPMSDLGKPSNVRQISRRDGAQEAPIKIVGKVRHFSPYIGSYMSVGLSFTTITDVDKIRLIGHLISYKYGNETITQEYAHA